MSDFRAISHLLLGPLDLNGLRGKAPQEAANALAGILGSLDTVEKQAFAVRGMCCLLLEERELWKEFTDTEVGLPYASLDRFLKQTLPNSWGYCRDALRAVKELREMPFQDLLDMPRCNIETLKKVSSNIRKEPKVIEAAKTLTESQFAAKLSKDYGQHIESKSTLKFTYTASELAEVERALDRIGKQLVPPIEDRAAQLLAWCIDSNIENQEDVA